MLQLTEERAMATLRGTLGRARVASHELTNAGMSPVSQADVYTVTLGKKSFAKSTQASTATPILGSDEPNVFRVARAEIQ